MANHYQKNTKKHRKNTFYQYIKLLLNSYISHKINQFLLLFHMVLADGYNVNTDREKIRSRKHSSEV